MQLRAASDEKRGEGEAEWWLPIGKEQRAGSALFKLREERLHGRLRGLG